MSKPWWAAPATTSWSGTAITGGTVDLGSGNDKLTLANAATNTVTIANVETLAGGTGDDIVTLTTTSPAAPSIWAGNDALTLANAAQLNTATIANIETLVGGTGDDIVTLGRDHRRPHRPRFGRPTSLTLANAARQHGDAGQCRNPVRRHG